jgi:DNA anti-recombination protein RmuC
MNALEDLRQQYMTNYYLQKIEKIEHKEEVLDKARQILQEIINEIGTESGADSTTNA